MNNQQHGWLPENGKHEDKIADDLLNHAIKPTTYSLDGFARSKNINITDLEDLGKHCTGHLPNTCLVAETMVKLRQDQTDALCIFITRDKDDRVMEEVQLIDETTGEWYIKHTGYVS